MNDRPRSRRAAPRSESPTGELTLELRLQSRRWREVGDLRPRIEAAIGAALALARLQPLAGAELSLLLTDDKRIRAVNREWRGFDKPTNVLSFPAAPPERIAMSPVLGDIVLAFETLVREAEAEEKSLGDHLSHLVIHGLLHLLGEDHETEAEAQRMEAMETAALARLGIADPYAGSDPHPTQPPPAAASRKKQFSPAP
ncbi:rRNA maturation RNase YbeY [Bosea sp. (in: a-proteobacteria)]|uniref:rRNA maturation RNase YbeY n=1 Tax=Bosea sp. (in: a-proteobacteria) TaxID=1871050 RepID=UPI002FC5C77E